MIRKIILLITPLVVFGIVVIDALLGYPIPWIFPAGVGFLLGGLLILELDDK